MKIIDIIRDNQGKGHSLEFFPPKTQLGIENIKNRILKFYSSKNPPRFIDLTWGAGGSTSDTTFGLTKHWNDMSDIWVNMHLTCTNIAVDEIDKVLDDCANAGIRNIVALRGDPPGDISGEWHKATNGFSCALDLVKHIRSRPDGKEWCITVSGYPEGHSSSFSKIDVAEIDSLSDDEKNRLTCDLDNGEYWVCRDVDFAKELEYLKKKVDAGADLIVTQLFWNCNLFLKFVERCREIGIICPILPGIMLFQNIRGFKRMSKKQSVPEEIAKKVKELEEIEKLDPEVAKLEILEYGEQLGKNMCKELKEGSFKSGSLKSCGVEWFHFYTLNKERVAKSVVESLY
tara:strand:- start:4843 stop:5874 length:1032 start_codon:yes stop_codon:yes gene_type:complete